MAPDIVHGQMSADIVRIVG